LVFVATFFIGFEFGSLYQQAKDYSALSLTTPQSTSISITATDTNQTSENGNINVALPTTTQFNGMLVCKSNSDCPTDYSCLMTGPIISGQQKPKVCVPNNQAIPL
jgi:hypothetical protein